MVLTCTLLMTLRPFPERRQAVFNLTEKGRDRKSKEKPKLRPTTETTPLQAPQWLYLEGRRASCHPALPGPVQLLALPPAPLLSARLLHLRAGSPPAQPGSSSLKLKAEPVVRPAAGVGHSPDLSSLPHGSQRARQHELHLAFRDQGVRPGL